VNFSISDLLCNLFKKYKKIKRLFWYRNEIFSVHEFGKQKQHHHNGKGNGMIKQLRIQSRGKMTDASVIFKTDSGENISETFGHNVSEIRKAYLFSLLSSPVPDLCGSYR